MWKPCDRDSTTTNTFVVQGTQLGCAVLSEQKGVKDACVLLTEAAGGGKKFLSQTFSGSRFLLHNTQKLSDEVFSTRGLHLFNCFFPSQKSTFDIPFSVMFFKVLFVPQKGRKKLIVARNSHQRHVHTA